MKAFLGAQLPVVVFILAFLPGLAMTITVHSGGERRLKAGLPSRCFPP